MLNHSHSSAILFFEMKIIEHEFFSSSRKVSIFLSFIESDRKNYRTIYIQEH